MQYENLNETLNDKLGNGPLPVNLVEKFKEIINKN